MARCRLRWTHSCAGAARWVAGALSVVVGSGAAGCLQRPIEPIEPRTTTTIVERITQSSVDKIDLLLAIDNSASMADKQAILALAVPDLVKGLVNPPCVSPTDPSVKQAVASPLDECPNGLKREFDPVLDIHIGILSSSIGSFGSATCKGSAADPSDNDKGHLLARSDPSLANDLAGETYAGKLFLAWDPNQQYAGDAGTPDQGDGEADLDADSDRDLNSAALLPTLSNMVRGAGQEGCGYEAQLESWYRFLVDPEPYQTLTVVDGQATPQGTDTELLTQRADFLRPNSLLAIVQLTDENDCSVREGGEYYYATTIGDYNLPRARSECAIDPNDPCCKSCVQDRGDCPVDPSCHVNMDPSQPVASLSPDEDKTGHRCFDQKRRFGIDFLYPISRYTDALSSPQIQNRGGELVDNPIFSDLNPGDDVSGIRDPGLVFYAGIVGVPWQDIARDPGDLTKGFKSSEELLEPVAGLGSAWEILVGDPAAGTPPADPFMQESITPRPGTNPITGTALVPPGGALNEINGSEWDTSNKPGGDLQYACIFPLPVNDQRDCSTSTGSGCDCKAGESAGNPLCESTTQVRAKAYPGIRELSLIQSVKSQGIVGSVCPAQLDDQARPDFGYRPAIGAIVDRLKKALRGQCLPRSLTPDDQGQVQCVVIEARSSQGACACDPATGRREVQPAQAAAQRAIEEQKGSNPWDCYCEVVQLEGDGDGDTQNDPLSACQYDVEEPVQLGGQDVHGWCYIDATSSPPVGDASIVAECASTERRLIRFVGQGEAPGGATQFITCAGEQGK